MLLHKVDFSSFRAPRVLLVEDNALIGMDLEDILNSYGCQVIGPRVSVQDAMIEIQAGEVDVAVLDFMLEDGTATPLAKALDDKGIPFAMCTGAGEGEMSTLFPNTPILNKPYCPEDVSRVVNSLIASRLASS